MNAGPRLFVASLVLATPPAFAQGPPGTGGEVPEENSWEFAVTAYPTVVRGGENYTSAIAAADRGPLHLEARYNYESIGARSAFVGWTGASRASRWPSGFAWGLPASERAYGGERDIQRGPFLQVTLGPFTLGGYGFNPGSDEQVFVGAIGAAF